MTPKEIPKIVKNAKDIFTRLKEKYADLSAYLVFSSPLGQVELTTDPLTILREFPKMFLPSQSFDLAQKHLKEITDLEETLKSANEKTKNELMKNRSAKESDLLKILPTLEIDPDIQVELRFQNLNYGLISKLQRDELIDQKLTSKSSASIRIVLGTLKSFLEET